MPPQRRTDGHELVRGHVEHAVDFEGGSQHALFQGRGLNVGQLPLVARERNKVGWRGSAVGGNSGGRVRRFGRGWFLALAAGAEQ